MGGREDGESRADRLARYRHTALRSVIQSVLFICECEPVQAALRGLALKVNLMRAGGREAGHQGFWRLDFAARNLSQFLNSPPSCTSEAAQSQVKGWAVGAGCAAWGWQEN